MLGKSGRNCKDNIALEILLSSNCKDFFSAIHGECNEVIQISDGMQRNWQLPASAHPHAKRTQWITESLRMEKSSKIIKSNQSPSTAKSTINPCFQVL